MDTTDMDNSEQLSYGEIEFVARPGFRPERVLLCFDGLSDMQMTQAELLDPKDHPALKQFREKTLWPGLMKMVINWDSPLDCTGPKKRVFVMAKAEEFLFALHCFLSQAVDWDAGDLQKHGIANLIPLSPEEAVFWPDLSKPFTLFGSTGILQQRSVSESAA